MGTRDASEAAGAFLNDNTTGDARAGSERGATGEYARLREFVLEKDELTDDEQAEFDELVAKRRAGTLTGGPARTVYKREAVAGDRGERTASTPKSPSEVMGAYLTGRS